MISLTKVVICNWDFLKFSSNSNIAGTWTNICTQLRRVIHKSSNQSVNVLYFFITERPHCWLGKIYSNPVKSTYISWPLVIHEPGNYIMFRNWCAHDNLQQLPLPNWEQTMTFLLLQHFRSVELGRSEKMKLSDQIRHRDCISLRFSLVLENVLPVTQHVF